MSTKQTGDRGEAAAVDYLEREGYMILDRNYRFLKSEVDIVCFEPSEQYERGGELAFVEVKTRTNAAFGSPEAGLTADQKKNLVRAAEAYLHERRLEGSPCRFDVIAVKMKDGEEPEIEHFKHAFFFF